MKKGMNSHFLRRKAVQQGWRARGGSGLRRTGILQGPSPGSPHVLQSRSELSRVQPDRALLRRAPQPGPESPALWQRPLAQQTLPPCPHSGHEAPQEPCGDSGFCPPTSERGKGRRVRRRAWGPGCFLPTQPRLLDASPLSCWPRPLRWALRGCHVLGAAGRAPGPSGRLTCWPRRTAGPGCGPARLASCPASPYSAPW